MPIFSIAPLSPLTPSTPPARADLTVEALARIAVIQTVETLGAMIDQSQSEAANLGKDAVGEGEASRAKAAEARAATAPETQAETPARAVAAAAGRAAARQAGLAPLMADMARAAAEPDAPPRVKAAIAQVMALSTRLDGQISAPEIRQALQRSGLFLEARLASAAPAGETPRPPTGTLTAPPKLVPAPTPNSDMKAALLVFREVVKTWLDAMPPASAHAGASGPAPTPTPASTQAPGATPASSGTPDANLAREEASRPPAPSPAPSPPLVPDRAGSGPPASGVAAPTASLPAATAGGAVLDAAAAAPDPPVRGAPISNAPRDAAGAELPRPSLRWPGLAAPPPAAARPASPPLPAFGAIVTEDFLASATPATPPRAAVAAMAYGGPEAARSAPSQTPPPYAGAPTHAQAAAQPGLPPGADPRAVAQRLLTEAGAALARTELLQIASLPEPATAGRPLDDHGPRWVFDMPFMTPQGPAAAQFEISRDGGGGGGEGDRALGRTWRARFSLDVEPMGPVHVQVALTGDRARVSLWAERPSGMARLRVGEERLNSALREAALEPELAFHAGQPRAPAAAPGQFLDQAT